MSDTVARLDDRLLAVLGGRSPMIRLSNETARKQAEKHPEVKSDDYARVQDVVDQGVVVRQGERTLVFVAETEAGKWWRLVVKRTADGRDTYLVAFHRIKPNQVRSAPRRDVAKWSAMAKTNSWRQEVPKVSSRSRGHESRSWLGRR